MLFDDAEPVVAAYRNLEERYANTVKHPPVRQTLAVSMAHGTAQSMPRNTIDAFCMDHPDVLLSVEEVHHRGRAWHGPLGRIGHQPGGLGAAVLGRVRPHAGGGDGHLRVRAPRKPARCAEAARRRRHRRPALRHVRQTQPPAPLLRGNMRGSRRETQHHHGQPRPTRTCSCAPPNSSRRAISASHPTSNSSNRPRTFWSRWT